MQATSWNMKLLPRKKKIMFIVSKEAAHKVTAVV
jgi:hypothetical protein